MKRVVLSVALALALVLSVTYTIHAAPLGGPDGNYVPCSSWFWSEIGHGSFSYNTANVHGYFYVKKDTHDFRYCNEMYAETDWTQSGSVSNDFFASGYANGYGYYGQSSSGNTRATSGSEFAFIAPPSGHCWSGTSWVDDPAEDGWTSPSYCI